MFKAEAQRIANIGTVNLSQLMPVEVVIFYSPCSNFHTSLCTICNSLFDNSHISPSTISTIKYYIHSRHSVSAYYFGLHQTSQNLLFMHRNCSITDTGVFTIR
ncbi:hypothetical protein V6Z12_A01G042600 [Gossypium hirsutum]